MKPIHIRLTSEFLVVYVDLETLLNDTFMHYCSERVYSNWLQYWTQKNRKRRRLLIVSLHGTQVSQTSKKVEYRRMQSAATSLGWMVARYQSREEILAIVNILRCQDISNV